MPVQRPDNCPPGDAHPVDQEYLRFVSGDLADGATPAADCWLLPYEQPKSPYFGRVEDCACHAHSLLADPQDVDKARSLIPAFKKKRIARVTITSDMGVVKHTPRPVADSHHSWWPDPVDLVPDATVIP
jgi:hypothetical protein